MLNTLLFLGITADEQHLLLTNPGWFKVRQFNERDSLVQKGDKASSIFVLLQGEALVVIDAETKLTLKVGDVFGEVSFFQRDRLRTASVFALDDLHVAEMPFTALDELAQQKPRLAIKLLTNMGHILAIRLMTADERTRQANRAKTKDPGLLASLRRTLGAS